MLTAPLGAAGRPFIPAGCWIERAAEETLQLLEEGVAELEDDGQLFVSLCFLSGDSLRIRLAELDGVAGRWAVTRYALDGDTLRLAGPPALALPWSLSEDGGELAFPRPNHRPQVLVPLPDSPDLSTDLPDPGVLETWR